MALKRERWRQGSPPAATYRSSISYSLGSLLWLQAGRPCGCPACTSYLVDYQWFGNSTAPISKAPRVSGRGLPKKSVSGVVTPGANPGGTQGRAFPGHGMTLIAGDPDCRE